MNYLKGKKWFKYVYDIKHISLDFIIKFLCNDLTKLSFDDLCGILSIKNPDDNNSINSKNYTVDSLINNVKSALSENKKIKEFLSLLSNPVVLIYDSIKEQNENDGCENILTAHSYPVNKKKDENDQFELTLQKLINGVLLKLLDTSIKNISEFCSSYKLTSNYNEAKMKIDKDMFFESGKDFMLFWESASPKSFTNVRELYREELAYCMKNFGKDKYKIPKILAIWYCYLFSEVIKHSYIEDKVLLRDKVNINRDAVSRVRRISNKAILNPKISTPKKQFVYKRRETLNEFISDLEKYDNDNNSIHINKSFCLSLFNQATCLIDIMLLSKKNEISLKKPDDMKYKRNNKEAIRKDKRTPKKFINCFTKIEIKLISNITFINSLGLKYRFLNSSKRNDYYFYNKNIIQALIFLEKYIYKIFEKYLTEKLKLQKIIGPPKIDISLKIYEYLKDLDDDSDIIEYFNSKKNNNNNITNFINAYEYLTK